MINDQTNKHKNCVLTQFFVFQFNQKDGLFLDALHRKGENEFGLKKILLPIPRGSAPGMEHEL